METHHSGELTAKGQSPEDNARLDVIVPGADIQLVEHYVVGQRRIEDGVLKHTDLHRRRI